MRFTKRGIAFICCLVCLLLCGAALAVGAEEQQVYTSGDYKYVVLNDGTAEITRYTGKAAELSVPKELDGYAVTSIGEGAFYRSQSLTTVVLPEGVTSIGNKSFFQCSSLTRITIPDSVMHIGENPFAQCGALEEIFVSESHPTLELIEGALCYKPNKELICSLEPSSNAIYTIPEGIESIGVNAFLGCSWLTQVVIPDTVTNIGDYAFSRCNFLTSVTISNSVVEIGSNPFSQCQSLRMIRVSPDHPTLAVIDGVLFYKPEKRLVCYPYAFTGERYSIPSGILSVGESAFSNCECLKMVFIPEGVIEIGKKAFYWCTSLTLADIPNSVRAIGDSAFESTQLTKVTIPDGVTQIGASTFWWCESLTSINIPNSVKTIGNLAFSYTALTTLSIPNNVNSIGASAFWHCESLLSVTIPSSVTNIGEGAFGDCEKLRLTVDYGSSAEQYAKANNIIYKLTNGDTSWLNG